MGQVKKTAFYKKHTDAGAKMVDFAGYKMPMLYDGIVNEHKAVRESVGMFDVSHMGEFEIYGPGAEDFINRVVTNNVATLTDYQVQYNCMCYNHGGIVDDLLVYKLPDKYMLVVNADNLEKDFNWIQENLPESGVTLINRSDETALIALQGPNAQKILQSLTKVQLDDVKYYHITEGEVASKNVLLSRTGYTGEDGFELYIPVQDNPESIWDALMDAGRQYDIKPAGLGARDSLRLEMGYNLYGNDMDEKTNPFEARLGWIVKLEKLDFFGREALIDAKTEGIKKKLMPFKLQERGFPRQHQMIIKDGEEVGEVTSGVFSPMLNEGVGLGYIKKELANVGEDICIKIRKHEVPAQITQLPFWKNSSIKR